MYNGGLLLTAKDHFEAPASAPPLLATAARRINESPLRSMLSLKERPLQITVTTMPGSSVGGSVLAAQLSDLIRRRPALALKVIVSAHSVDIVPSTSTKTTVLAAVEGAALGRAIAIGDQGQSGGNDFELLAGTDLSLSVDRCSSDPTRCWNLGRSTDAGPTTLARYLAALTNCAGALYFKWDDERRTR